MSKKIFLKPRINKCLTYCQKEIREIKEQFKFIQENFKESEEINKLDVKQLIGKINKLQKSVDSEFGLLGWTEKKFLKEIS